MRNEILVHIDNPGELEKMYRTNKSHFISSFQSLYPELKGNPLAEAWHERLNYESGAVNWGTGRELLLVLIGSLVAGFIAKIPAVFPITEEFFYPRNIGFVFLPLLTIYFAWKNNLHPTRLAITVGLILLSLTYINVLPSANNSDTLTLACIHLLIVLWAVLGSAFTGNNLADNDRRLIFLRYNGDLLVMTSLIVIAGGVMSGITIGLFSVIGLPIEKFYFENVVVTGLAAAPLVGTYLIQENPQLVGKVSPVIARIFSPLVLIMLITYLVAILFSGRNPYTDREFLLIFNALLIGVMAIIFFVVSDAAKTAKTSFEIWILFLLSVLTIVVNGIALSAILYRIAEWGFTPNRAAVLGGNVLILANLLMVTFQLYRVVSRKVEISGVGKAIAVYLPVYAVWAGIVLFLFPVFFGFK